MKKIKLNLILLIALVPLLTFCGGVRDALEGKKRSEQSDEFLVKKKNPLQMPPDINKLPMPGDDLEVSNKSNNGEVKFFIQGDGNETRSFCYVDDVIDGILRMYENGSHREIYHIGNNQEISIRDLIAKISLLINCNLVIQTSPKAEGGTPRRCPDIQKMKSIVVTW